MRKFFFYFMLLASIQLQAKVLCTIKIEQLIEKNYIFSLVVQDTLVDLNKEMNSFLSFNNKKYKEHINDIINDKVGREITLLNGSEKEWFKSKKNKDEDGLYFSLTKNKCSLSYKKEDIFITRESLQKEKVYCAHFIELKDKSLYTALSCIHHPDKRN